MARRWERPSTGVRQEAGLEGLVLLGEDVPPLESGFAFDVPESVDGVVEAAPFEPLSFVVVVVDDPLCGSAPRLSLR